MGNDNLVCNVCGLKFGVSTDLNNHKNIEHNEGENIANEQPYNQGEQSISGSTPGPESDDNTLENAQSMGQQLDEDDEHPQELDIARDVDNAEEHIRTH